MNLYVQDYADLMVNPATKNFHSPSIKQSQELALIAHLVKKYSKSIQRCRIVERFALTEKIYCLDFHLDFFKDGRGMDDVRL